MRLVLVYVTYLKVPLIKANKKYLTKKEKKFLSFYQSVEKSFFYSFREN